MKGTLAVHTHCVTPGRILPAPVKEAEQKAKTRSRVHLVDRDPGRDVKRVHVQVLVLRQELPFHSHILPPVDCKFLGTKVSSGLTPRRAWDNPYIKWRMNKHELE